MVDDQGKLHWPLKDNQCFIAEVLGSDTFTLRQVKQSGKLMNWIVSVSDPKAEADRFFSICCNFGGGLYCDMASTVDLDSYPTSENNLVTFRYLFCCARHT